jgi:hypothetical protein
MSDELFDRLQDWHDAAVALAATAADDPAYEALVRLVQQAAHRYESAATVVAVAEFLGLRARPGEPA